MSSSTHLDVCSYLPLLMNGLDTIIQTTVLFSTRVEDGNVLRACSNNNSYVYLHLKFQFIRIVDRASRK
jgi:hypothetical protein